MDHRRIRIVIVLHTVLQFGTIWLAFALYETSLYVAAAAGAAAVVQVFALVRYLARGRENLIRQAVKAYELRTLREAGVSGEEDGVVVTEEDGSRRRATLDELQELVAHFPVGLLLYGPDGAVVNVNPKALRLLGVRRLRNIHTLSRSRSEVARAVFDLRPEQRKLVRASAGGGDVLLEAQSVHVGELPRTLVSMNDLGRTIEEHEVKTWQKTLGALVKQIMNSGRS